MATDSAGRAAPDKEPAPGPWRTILVVCYGNVCRSPVAAALLESRLKDRGWQVVAAGTDAVDGKPVADLTVVAAADCGVDLSSVRSRRLLLEDIEAATIILAMSHRQARRIIEMAPHVRRRIRLLGAFDPQPNTWGLPADPRAGNAAEEEIPDPIGQDLELHRDVCRRLTAAVDRLVEWMDRREARLRAGPRQRPVAGAPLDAAAAQTLR